MAGPLAEVQRVLRPGGVFAFTTKWPDAPLPPGAPFARVAAGELDVFSHAPEYVRAELDAAGLAYLRLLRCFVGQDVFGVWVVCRGGGEPS